MAAPLNGVFGLGVSDAFSGWVPITVVHVSFWWWVV